MTVLNCFSVSHFKVTMYFPAFIEQINRLPPEVVKYFTDPNAIDPPDMELLFPFVESALPLAYGVLGVLLFHVSRSLPVCWFCFIFKVYSIACLCA